MIISSDLKTPEAVPVVSILPKTYLLPYETSFPFTEIILLELKDNNFISFSDSILYPNASLSKLSLNNFLTAIFLFLQIEEPVQGNSYFDLTKKD